YIDLVQIPSRSATLNDLRHSVLLKLICRPNSFVHLRLSLVSKLPSKPYADLGALRRSCFVSRVFCVIFAIGGNMFNFDAVVGSAIDLL
ncbi:hypothetical protein C8N36_1011, partial [Pelagimonas varians]|uniref:hypothetical protein n=1 Tax=Pelagimonas varians TaxID=696760 RepID=UPI000D9D6DC3